MLRRLYVRTALVFTLTAGSLFAQPCSLETIRGTWSFQSSAATLFMADGQVAPFAALGMHTFDAQGRMTGWSNLMLAGTYIDISLSGTVAVKPDCTGTLRFSATPQGAPGPLPGEDVWRIVVLEGGNEMRTMMMSTVLGSATGTATYRRLVSGRKDPPACTPDMARGTYATVVDGTVLQLVAGQAAALPYSGLGAFSLDGRGEITGGSMVSTAGRTTEVEVVNARLELLGDCTGYVTYQAKPKGAPGPIPGQGMDKVIVLENGAEIRGLAIGGVLGAPILPELWKRISKEPGAVGW